MDKNKKTVLIGALDYMQEVDTNGTWDEASEELQHGTDALDSEIAYMIETLRDWKVELDEGDKDIAIMNYWIEHLKILV